MPTPSPRRASPIKSAEGATYNMVVRKGADGAMRLERVAIAPMPDELKQVIEEQK